MSFEQAKQRILEATSLSSLMAELTKVTKRSGRDVVLCPFHEEKSPSCVIYDDHYFCFGCRARGDAIDLVRHRYGYSFIEALKFLADKFGVEAPELVQNRDYELNRRKHERLISLMELAQAFYRKAFEKQASLHDYLITDRGFSEDLVNSFPFGYADQEPFGLVRFLESRGFKLPELVECSLANRSERSGSGYDFFKNRLMIPICDRMGRVIAFGGRTLDDDPAKYKNSRETPLFDKSRILFGLDRAREAIRKSGRVIIAEGYMDVLMMWNCGFENAVACMGTAISEHHLKVLANFTSEIILLFDGDKAGRTAGLRTISQALKYPSLQLKIALLPMGQDPDSFLQAEGREAMTSLLLHSKGLFEHAIRNRLENSHDLAVPDILSKDVIPWLASIQDPVERGYLVNKTSELTGIDVGPLVEGRPNSANASHRNREKQASPQAPIQMTAAEFELLGHLYFASPDLDVQKLRSLIDRQHWDPRLSHIATEMLSAIAKGKPAHELDEGSWATQIGDEAWEATCHIAAQPEAFETEDRMAAITKLAGHIRKQNLKISVSRLKHELHKLQGDPSQRNEIIGILRGIQELNKEINQLEA